LAVNALTDLEMKTAGPTSEATADFSLSLLVGQLAPWVRGGKVRQRSAHDPHAIHCSSHGQVASWLAFNFITFMGTSAVIGFGVTSSHLRVPLGLSPLQESLLDACPLLGVAAVCIPATLVSRRHGGRYISVVLCMVTAAAMAIAAALCHWANLAGLAPLFYILGLLMGCGLATVNCGLIQCWWWSEKYQGTVVGVLLFSTTCGPAVLGAIAAPIISAWGLAGFYLFWSLCLVGAAALALLLGHDPPYVQLVRLAHAQHYDVQQLPPHENQTSSKHYGAVRVMQDDIKASSIASAGRIF
jgi:MFS family permease